MKHNRKTSGELLSKDWRARWVTGPTMSREGDWRVEVEGALGLMWGGGGEIKWEEGGQTHL